MVSREGGIETENEEESRSEIWQKGKIIPGTNPDEYRKDESGYWMKYDQFRTDDKLAWDYEQRMKGMSGYPEYYPRAVMRITLVDREVDNIVEEKKRKQN